MEEKNKNTPPYQNPHLYSPVPSGHKSQTPNTYKKLNVWLKNHPKLVLGCLTTYIIVVGVGLLYILGTGTFNSTSDPLKAQQPPKKIFSLLTGLEVSEGDSKRPITALMIENSPEARPQSGLKDAGVVFESVAEGGITRFLILYQESKPGIIGPVRSVRPQFASWAAAFDAGLAHVGGSDIPLQKLRSGQIKDLDQFFNPDAFWRANDRYSPHNVYTNDERLQVLNKAKGYLSSVFTSWLRPKKESPSATPTATTIAIPVSTGPYSVSYTWDPASNSYLRSQGGIVHTDREKGQITPKTVIAIQVPHDVIRDSNGYSYPEVNGTGRGWLFQDGAVQEIIWEKANDKAQIRFTDSEGKEVKINRGQTWITAIKTDTVPTWQ